MDRVSTGIDGLDRVLEGGLPKNALHIIAGVPGTGKTTVAQQIAFANAREDRPALILTTMAEPLPKLVTYLQELDFVSPQRIGTEVVFESLEEDLKDRPSRLAGRLLELIQRHRPGLIIIDSFKAIGDVVSELGQWRGILFEIAGVLGAYDATAILVGEYTEAEMAGAVEFAVADGVLELRREQRGSRDERLLRVAKMRGSDFLDGHHAFTISRAGVWVYPRLVGPRQPMTYVPDPERIPSGIIGLDEMIETGWLRGTSTLVIGPAGAGKTMLGLHFLRRGVEDGEATLMVTFQETPTQLRRAIRSLGWNDRELVDSGKFALLYRSPVELQIDTIVHEIFRRIEEDGVRRVVVDALGDLERAAGDPARFSDYVYALAQHLATRQVSSMFMLEAVGPVLAGQTNRSEAEKTVHIVDNLLSLNMTLGGELRRSIRIIKSRGSAHDGEERILRIGTNGLEIENDGRR